MDAPSTSKPAAPVTRCLDTTLEYLLLETIRYYATLADQVAAVHAVETMGFRIGSQLAERCGQLSAPQCAARWPRNCVRRTAKCWCKLYGTSAIIQRDTHKGIPKRTVCDRTANGV